MASMQGSLRNDANMVRNGSTPYKKAVQGRDRPRRSHDSNDSAAIHDSGGTRESSVDSTSHLWKEINEVRRPALRNSDLSADLRDIMKLNEVLNESCFARLVRNRKFELTTLLVIVMNALFIGYDVDYAARFGKPDELYNLKTWGFPVMENFFTIYFTFEVVIRFFAFRRWINLCDAWFIFDTGLVILMIAETYVLAFVASGGGVKQLSILRLLRLLRITRMGKLMRYFPELQVIVVGMLAAVRSVAVTAVLLIMVLYVFSIIFTNVFHQGLLDDAENESRCEEGIPSACAHVLFGSLGKSMRHLFIMGTILDDLTKGTNAIRSASNNPIMLLVFITFVLISSFTVLNMLIGIMCEVVAATAEAERRKSSAARIKEAITSLFSKLDEDNSGTISRDEFLNMQDDKDVTEALSTLKIKPKHFQMYADLMFKEGNGSEDDGSMSLELVCNLLMQLRPGSQVEALDFACFSKMVSKNHFHVRSGLIRLDRLLTALLKEEEHEAGNWDTQPVKKQVTVQDLEKIPDHEIIGEICKRLGMNAQILRPYELQSPKDKNHKTTDTTAKAVEAFEILGVPYLESDTGDSWKKTWSKEIYSC